MSKHDILDYKFTYILQCSMPDVSFDFNNYIGHYHK